MSENSIPMNLTTDDLVMMIGLGVVKLENAERFGRAMAIRNQELEPIIADLESQKAELAEAQAGQISYEELEKEFFMLKDQRETLIATVHALQKESVDLNRRLTEAQAEVLAIRSEAEGLRKDLLEIKQRKARK